MLNTQAWLCAAQHGYNSDIAVSKCRSICLLTRGNLFKQYMQQVRQCIAALRMCQSLPALSQRHHSIDAALQMAHHKQTTRTIVQHLVVRLTLHQTRPQHSTAQHQVLRLRLLYHLNL